MGRIDLPSQAQSALDWEGSGSQRLCSCPVTVARSERLGCYVPLVQPCGARCAGSDQISSLALLPSKLKKCCTASRRDDALSLSSLSVPFLLSRFSSNAVDKIVRRTVREGMEAGNASTVTAATKTKASPSRMLPTSPNWYCSSVCDCSVEGGIYAYGAKNEVQLLDIASARYLFLSSSCLSKIRGCILLIIAQFNTNKICWRTFWAHGTRYIGGIF